MGLLDLFWRDRGHAVPQRPMRVPTTPWAPTLSPLVARVVTARPVSPAVSGKGVVRPDNTPLHVQRGWTKKGNIYTGYYRTKYGAYRGEISEVWGEFRIYIFKPPMNEIDRHPKRPCFSSRGGDRWYINLYQQPRKGKVDDCIWYVEQLLIEAHIGTFNKEEFIAPF